MAWVLGMFAVDACNDAQEMYVWVLGRQHYVSAILDAYVPVRYSTPRDLQQGEREPPDSAGILRLEANASLFSGAVRTATSVRIQYKITKL